MHETMHSLVSKIAGDSRVVSCQNNFIKCIINDALNSNLLWKKIP